MKFNSGNFRFVFRGLNFIVVVFILMACSEKKNERAKDLKEEWSEAASETKEFLKEGSKNFKKESEVVFSDIEKKLEDLRGKLKTKNGEGRNQIQKQIDDLEGKKNELKEKLNKSGDNAKENWEEFKSSTRKAMTNIENRIDSMK